MKRILNILFLMVMAFSLSAQTTLTFEGKDRTGQDYVRLSRVSIDNDDQLWHQNIYYPDTVLVLYANGTVGIETFHETFLQMQNNPNPFDGTTDVVLSTPYDGDVTMEITDVNGHIVGTHCVRPQSGTHQFRITLSTPGTYVLTARQTGHTVSVKMVNMGNGGGKGIEYMGTVEKGRAPSLQLTPKSGTRGDGHYPFRSWDRMRYTGYAMVDDTEIASETVEKRQIASEVIPLRFDIARPEVETHAASNIAATSVVLNGEVLTDNNANVTERGFIYIKNSGLWNFGTDVAAGNGSGAYSTQLTGLFPATTYHVKAYATNAVGTTYGQVETFRTMDTLPVVTTTEPSNISATTFTSGGEVLALNSTGLTARGICWNTTGVPTVADNHTTQSGGLGSFTANVTGLSCGTTYYVRAYATNSVGAAYGEEYTAITTQELAMVNTAVISDITDNSAVCGGTVTYDGCSEVTARGVCWSTSHNPTIADNHTTDGSGLGDFTSNMTGANYATTYYVRGYATNGVGTAYGDEISFTTQPIMPIVTTATVTDITATTFTSGGVVASDGGASVTARGICWSTEQNPTIADSHTTDGGGLGIFTSNVTGLSCGTTYYMRAYATNSVGTAYGEEYSVTSLNPNHSIPQVEFIEYQLYTKFIVLQSEVLSENCEEVTERGVCWSLSHNPTISDCRTINGYGEGIFVDTLVGLLPDTTYYIRAYATNSLGTAYGNEEEFILLPIAQSLTVNDGTATNEHIPVYGYFVDAFDKCEFVIPAQRLSDMESGMISAMTFYLSSPASGSWGAASFQVFLKEITDTILNSFLGTNDATIVYEGPLDGTQSEMNINFNTTYAYHGGNLLVGVYNTVKGSYRRAVFYGITTENGSSVSGYNTSSLSSVAATQWNFLPKTSFNYESHFNDTELSCEVPSDIFISHITSDSAIVHWNSNATMWLLNINGTASIVTDNPCTVTDLTPETEYTIKVCALCCNGKSEWSDVVSFTTNSALPTVTTASATLIAESSATLGGSVISNGSSIVSSRGVCWSTLPSPTIADSHTVDGNGIGSFTSCITGLVRGTPYYVRAYATNSYGTVYGNEVFFITPNFSDGQPCPNAATLTDRDGNTYNTVQIGAQCWMKDNLKTTKYADGTSISHGNDTSSTIAYWYYPNGNPSNKSDYGLLYNWKAAMRNSSSSYNNPSGTQGICPTGWHLPSCSEWDQLTDYVSSQSQYACGGNNTYIAKAMADSVGWNSYAGSCAIGDTSSFNNATGFSARPAGAYYISSYSSYGNSGSFWSATGEDFVTPRQALLCSFIYNQRNVHSASGTVIYASSGISVRCVKD